jgi:hypothetical protein
LEHHVKSAPELDDIKFKLLALFCRKTFEDVEK